MSHALLLECGMQTYAQLFGGSHAEPPAYRSWQNCFAVTTKRHVIGTLLKPTLSLRPLSLAHLPSLPGLTVKP